MLFEIDLILVDIFIRILVKVFLFVLVFFVSIGLKCFVIIKGFNVFVVKVVCRFCRLIFCRFVFFLLLGCSILV